VQISQVSCARPGGVSEDCARTGTDRAGATPVAGASTGCVHDVPWLVRQLAAAVSTRLLLDSAAPLAARHATTGTVPILGPADAAPPPDDNQHDDATAVCIRLPEPS